MTVTQHMGVHRTEEGGLIGRVMSEAWPNGIIPKGADGKIVSKPAANGLQTVVKYQRVLSQRYFDVAGFPGRSVGLEAEARKPKTAGEENPPRPSKTPAAGPTAIAKRTTRNTITPTYP